MILTGIILFALSIVGFAYAFMLKIKKRWNEMDKECPDGGIRSDVVYFVGPFKATIKIDKTEKPSKTHVQVFPNVESFKK